jgi:hypothetical protein
MQPEGLATGQIDQGFPWPSYVLEQVPSWRPNSMLLCTLLMQSPQLKKKKIRTKAALPTLSKFFQNTEHLTKN